MAPKFNLETADKDSLKERVKQLTSALVKQKEVIEKLRTSEDGLAADKERLEKQVQNLTEEAEMSRSMRGDLQSEVARLQNQVDLQGHELEILKDQSQPAESATAENHGWSPNEQKLESALKNAESEVTQLHEQVARHKGESETLSEQLEAMRSSYARLERKMAANSSFTTATSSFVGSVVGSDEVKMKDGALEENFMQPNEVANGDDSHYGVEASTGRPTEDDDVAAESESQLKLMEALSQARMDCVAKESLAARLQKELDQAKTGIVRAEEGRAAADSKISTLQATLEKSQAAYNQAKGYIQELEKARDIKDKELQSLKEGQQRRLDEEGAVSSKWNGENAQLKLKVSELQDQLSEKERDLQRAEKKTQSASEATASVEGRLRTLQNTISKKEKEFATQLKKVEEREFQLKKELEATKSQMEAAEQKHLASEEELRHQLEMDKQIVKGMQAEARAKAIEAETAILAAQSQLGEKDEQIKKLEEEMDATKTESAAQIECTPVRMDDEHVFADTPGGSDFDANFEGVFSSEAQTPLRENFGSVLVDQSVLHHALEAIEELIEALSSDTHIAQAIDMELVVLEERLSASHGDPVQRRIKALCGLCRVAVDHLNDTDLLRQGSSSKGHDLNRDIFDSNLPLKNRLLWVFQGIVKLTREGCCGWSDRGHLSGGYSRVVNPEC